MSFQVIKAGFQASIQDMGRQGLQQFGLSQSGALDEISARWANRILDNAPDCALLEIPYGQCELLAQANSFIVVTGADLQFHINDQPAPRFQILPIQVGDHLQWKHPFIGVRAYLAVAGGFQTDDYFDSRSTSPREQLGQAIHVGQSLPYHSHDTQPTYHPMPQSENRLPTHDLTLRLLPSYQFSQFSAQAQQQFLTQDFQVSAQFDRTACRLEGEPIEVPQPDMISEGMVFGAVQITHQGEPIIMLKDRPTIGGYPKIGTVFSLDLAQLAQAMPHTHVQFRLMNPISAQLKRRAFDHQLDNS